MRRMKIAFITPQSSQTGEQRYSELLINSLEKEDFEIEILDEFILTRHPFKVYLGSIFLKNILKRKNISIVHNLDNIGPFLFNKPDNSLCITNVWDIAPIILPEIHNWRIKLDFKLLSRLISNTDFVISPSKSTKNDLINKLQVEPEKIETIPLGIDLKTFYPRTLNSQILEKYDIKDNYILYTGTTNPRKNLSNLINAYIDIIEDISLNLVLVGPIKEEFIRNIITNSKANLSTNEIMNRIKILGYIDYFDLPHVYSAATIFVFPTLYEGFGLPPLESMACGTPVIVSNNSSINEVVGNSGVYIHNPLNHLEISEKIKMVLEDKKMQKKLIKRGIDRSKNFDWKKTVDLTIKFYKRVYKI